jgi:hypothetical protein
VEFVVDKMTLGQVFSEYFGEPLELWRGLNIILNWRNGYMFP